MHILAYALTCWHQYEPEIVKPIVDAIAEMDFSLDDFDQIDVFYHAFVTKKEICDEIR